MKLFSKTSDSAVAASIDVIVDEQNPFFKLADHSQFFRHVTTDCGIESYEGFHKNEQKQREAASGLADLLGFNGKVLDVGFGSNIYVASAFAQNGLEAHALDLEPLALNQDVKIYTGNASILGGKSNGLPDGFNAIIYWASWSSKGTAPRWATVVFGVPSLENYLAAVANKDSSLLGNHAEHSKQFLAEEQKLLEGSTKQLGYGGQLVIVSNRYSYAHGPSFLFEELPQEKRRMLHLAAVLEQLGAAEIKLIGASNHEMRQLAKQHEQQYTISYKRAHMLGSTNYVVNGNEMQRHEMNDEQVAAAIHPRWSGDVLSQEGKNVLWRTVEQLCTSQILSTHEGKVGAVYVPEPSAAETAAVQRFQGELAGIARIDAITARFYR